MPTKVDPVAKARKALADAEAKQKANAGRVVAKKNLDKARAEYAKFPIRKGKK